METNVQVRYQETDQMGVVYHANYFVWFEVARTAMVKRLGISYKQMEEKGLLMPVIDVSCRYIASAKYDDDLTIRARVIAYSGLTMEVEYEVIRKNDHELLAKGKTKHVWIDTNHRPIRMKKAFPDLHNLFNELVSS